jgi:anti-sigma-K factor RskA
MTLRCQEVDELLAPHALDALEPADRLEVLEHLSECRLHDEELAGYRDVASRLPLAVEAMAPPAGLRSNVVRRFEQEVAQSTSPEPAAPARRTGFFEGLFRRPGLGYGLAAALLATVIGLAAWNLTLNDEAPAAAVWTHVVEQNSMRMELVYIPDQQVGVVNLRVPAPAPGQDYQLWQITAEGPLSLGVVDYRQAAYAIQADLSGATALALSVEPLGGSVQPTTTPIIVVEL